MKYFDTQYNLFIADSDLNPLEQINTTKEKVEIGRASCRERV